MQSKRLQKIASIILVASFCVGASSASCNRIPEHTPYLVDLSSNRCIRCTITDKDRLLYSCREDAPCSDINGGFGFPPGQAEGLLQYIRDQKKACE